MNGHDYEPVPGLPAKLPAGEAILWQGKPCWRSLARRAFHVSQVAVYFTILLAWLLLAARSDGITAGELAFKALRLVGLAAAAVAILGGLAWLTARTTLYTITSRRVVVRFGMALPMTWNLPFAMVDMADLKGYADGTGDISMALKSHQRVAYLVMWPHVRPWHLTRAQPMLRGVSEAAQVAQILGRGLAAAAAQPVLPAGLKAAAMGQQAASAAGQQTASAAV